MPSIGYVLGSFFIELIDAYDHWVTFILLSAIGLIQIKESREASGNCNPSLQPYTMLMLAIATSIDALAVGVTFAFMNIAAIPSVTIIGVTTFLLSAIGIRAGGLFGNHYKSKVELVGGYRSHPYWIKDSPPRIRYSIKAVFLQAGCKNVSFQHNASLQAVLFLYSLSTLKRNNDPYSKERQKLPLHRGDDRISFLLQVYGLVM